MAEEKKTTTKKATTSKSTTTGTKKATTTKSTTKKVATTKAAASITAKKKAEPKIEEKVQEVIVEEVSSEKKFCTKCGKALNGSEVCDCNQTSSSPAVGININSDAILNSIANIWNVIVNVLKKPASTIDEELNKNGANKSIMLSILLAISFALYLISLVSVSVKGATAQISGLTTIIKVPYFKVFIYGILIYAVMAVIPMLASIIVAKLTRNNNYKFEKAFELYTISNAPMILAYLGMMVVLLINISLLNLLGYIAFIIISVACFFNFILGFNKETEVREDRRSYALTSVIVIWIAAIVLAVLLVYGSLAKDLDNYYGIKNSSNNYWDSYR